MRVRASELGRKISQIGKKHEKQTGYETENKQKYKALKRTDRRMEDEWKNGWMDGYIKQIEQI